MAIQKHDRHPEDEFGVPIIVDATATIDTVPALRLAVAKGFRVCSANKACVTPPAWCPKLVESMNFQSMLRAPPCASRILKLETNLSLGSQQDRFHNQDDRTVCPGPVSSWFPKVIFRPKSTMHVPCTLNLFPLGSQKPFADTQPLTLNP
jgi:hypothetical protein